MAKRSKKRIGNNQPPKKSSEEKKDRNIIAREKAKEIFDSAVELVIRTQKGSITLLQHELNIDYLVAAELINLLEKEGIIGPYSPSGPRKVLIGSQPTESDSVDAEENEVETETFEDEPHNERNIEKDTDKNIDELEDEQGDEKVQEDVDIIDEKELPEDNEEEMEENEKSDEDLVESEIEFEDDIDSSVSEEKDLLDSSDKTKETPGSPTRHTYWPALISVVIVFGLFALFFWPRLLTSTKTINVHIVAEVKLSDLIDTDDGVCEIYIDGQKFAETNHIGTAEFDYRTEEGASIRLEYKKENYESLSDSVIPINKKTTKIYQLIRFNPIYKETPYIVKSEPINYKVNLLFYNNSDYISTILLNTDTLTTLKAKTSFSWDSTYVDSEKARLEFKVANKEVPLITYPSTLIYNVNRNISTKVEIYAILDRPVFAEILFLEERSKTVLNNVDVKFSDSNKKYTSNDKGVVLHKLVEKRLGKSISINLPQKFVKFHNLDHDFSLGVLSLTTPDTIRDTVLCDVEYTVQLKIQDQNEEPIRQAEVVFSGTRKVTDNNGIVSFTVNDRSKNYSVKVEKERYNPLTTTIKPTGFISSFPIGLMGTYGSIILIDSLQNDITVPFVDVIENDQVLAQTNSEGKCKISIVLGKPIKLYLKPLPSSKYKSKEFSVTFQRPNETKYIKVSPHPYSFIFNVTDDKGKRLKGVNINYNGLSYSTDKKGYVKIENYVPNLKPSEEFEIVYYNYKEKRIVPTNENKRIYKINHVIGTEVEIEIRTNPEKANIRIVDMAGKEIFNDKAPAKVTVDLGTYRFIAEDNSGKYAEEIRDISGKLDAPLVLDMVNNIAIILKAYKDNDFQKVVQVYARNKSKVLSDLNEKQQYRNNKCDILRSIANAHSSVNQYGEAQTIWQNLILNCEEKNPYFYNDYGLVLEHNKNWADAADAYRKSSLYIELLPIHKRAEYNANLSYKQAYCMFNNYKSNKHDINNPCDYLSNIKDKINECKRAVNAGNLVNFPVANVENLMTQVLGEEYDCE